MPKVFEGQLPHFDDDVILLQLPEKPSVSSFSFKVSPSQP